MIIESFSSTASNVIQLNQTIKLGEVIMSAQPLAVNCMSMIVSHRMQSCIELTALQIKVKFYIYSELLLHNTVLFVILTTILMQRKLKSHSYYGKGQKYKLYNNSSFVTHAIMQKETHWPHCACK